VTGSELAGVAFNPDGTKLYVSSQRGVDATHGITYEISGPFRTVAPTEETLVAAGATWIGSLVFVRFVGRFR
jgi:secreted PhoX family phosphatase